MSYRQKQKQEILFQEWDETHHQLAKKKEDAERMKEVAKNAELIHEMSLDFNTIVHEQEECLDLMEEETEKVKADLTQANVDLKKAKKHQVNTKNDFRKIVAKTLESFF